MLEHDSEVEALLARMPVPKMSADARQETIRAILAAGTVSSRPWWARPLALWQCAAACLFLSLIAMGAGYRFGADGTGSPFATADPGEAQTSLSRTSLPRAFVEADPASIGLKPVARHRIDIAHWNLIERTDHETSSHG